MDRAEPAGTPPSRILLFAPLIPLVLFIFVFVRTAWLCEDAFITYRTVWNFVHGYGLGWNPGERVQAYTHPLWMLLISLAHFFTREIYYTPIAVSAIVSVAAVAIAGLWRAPSRGAMILALALLPLSRAFVDYSSSGLENPLTHLLLACYLVLLTTSAPSGRSFFLMSLVAALAATNRMDTILFYVPGLALWAWRLRRDWRALCFGALGWLPFLTWELFSLAYYGSFVPNPAYAKLGHGWSWQAVAIEGLRYLYVSLWKDPITLCLVGFAVLLAFAEKRAAHAAAALGVLLYVAYVVKVGGDFMGGRFLSAAYLAGVVLLSRSELAERTRAWPVMLGAAVLVAFATPNPTLLSGMNYRVDRSEGHVEKWKVGDERGWHYYNTGLLRVLAGKGSKTAGIWGEIGAAASANDVPLVCTGAIGVSGLTAGPDVYIVDYHALSDPLLARLPARKDVPLFMGHFERRIPDGYLETLLRGENVIRDPATARLYDRLQLITRGPLFGRERWKAILDLNLRRAEDEIDPGPYADPEDAYAMPAIYHVGMTQKSMPTPLHLRGTGIKFYSEATIAASRLKAVLIGAGSMEAIFARNGADLGSAVFTVNGRPAQPDSITINIPEAARAGFDRVWLRPVRHEWPVTNGALVSFDAPTEVRSE